MREFEIINVFNHNAILCKAINTEENLVFFGKGIGFKKKRGETFEYNSNVEDVKLVLEADEANKYKKLLQQVKNKKLVKVIQNVVYEANKYFQYKINAKLNLTLLDHLNFAIERQKNNIIMNYPFLNELQFIYPKEYKFAIMAFKYINEEMKDDIIFDKSELGFLILHIHAALRNDKVSNVLINNEITYNCLKIIEKEFNKKIGSDSIYYSRFIKHLEYAIYRFKNNIKLENILLDSVIDLCNKEYFIAEKINDLLNKKYRINLDKDELGYLALHIYNLRTKE